MFSYAFRSVFNVVLEIEFAVRRQFIESIDLTLTSRKRCSDVTIGEILQLHPSGRQSIPGQLLKSIVGQLACIFAVKPMQFIGIESGMTAHDLVQIEERDDFFHCHFLAIVLRRPTEQTKIIAERLGKETSLNIVVYARSLVPLAHFRPIAI